MADPSNYLIAGAMPFGPGGNPYQGEGIGNLGNAYQQSYQSALEQNKALYGNILAGYQQTMGNQVAAQGNIGQGYQQLYNNVLGGIQNIGASQAQAIQDTYAQQSGMAKQDLITRGLGNTTVTDSVQRGLMLDKQKAQVALANQMAQLQAGYQSQLGLAGLSQQNAANMQNTALAGQQLGWMNTVQAQYPNAQSYNQLAQMAGQAQQAAQDRAAMRKIGGGAATVGGGIGGATGFRNSPNRSMDFQPYGASNIAPYTSGFMGGFTGGGAAIYPSYGMGIQQPWPEIPPEYDTYDVYTQQGYNTFDPGYQGGYDTADYYDLSGMAGMPSDYYGAESLPSDYGGWFDF